jgi:diphosphomevalonate decarboxylase
VSALKATAVAHPNIALVKYWGKRDEDLVLPHQSSLSVTLEPLSVTTTVEFGIDSDAFEINGRLASTAENIRIRRVLDRLERSCGRKLGGAHVVSRGDFPEASGLASSAAAFAALAVAAQTAAKLPFNARQASILARLGSGSAARSVEGGFCVWHRGHRSDGEDSFAEQIHPETFWPDLRLVVALISSKPKLVTSRDGMRLTVETSPFYPTWVTSAEAEVGEAKHLIRARDLSRLGRLCERNAWRMHATALAADPSLCYFEPETLRLIQSVAEARQKGLNAWFTLDAGPNPIFLTHNQSEDALIALLDERGAPQIVRCRPGGSAQVVTKHLF